MVRVKKDSEVTSEGLWCGSGVYNTGRDQQAPGMLVESQGSSARKNEYTGAQNLAYNFRNSEPLYPVY